MMQRLEASSVAAIHFQIDAGEFATWLQPKAALMLLQREMSRSDAIATIWMHLNSGHLKVGAAQAVWANDDQSQPKDRWLVPHIFWRKLAKASLASVWKMGEMTVADAEQQATLSLHGIRFCTVNIDEILANFGIASDAAHASNSAKSTANRGGRPAYGWWEDLFIEIAAQLYNGTLTPKRQADIEKAMLHWIEQKNHSASEASVRIRARKLFTALAAEEET